MIFAKDLSIRFPNGHTPIKNLSFSINQGECVILYGKSGSGKTTLLKALSGIIPSLEPANINGKLKTKGNIGFMFQNTDSQLFTSSVEEELVLGLEYSESSVQIIEKKVNKIINHFNLVNKKNIDPLCLSGGEKQKTCLASVLIKNYDILLFDEPFSQIDRETREKLMSYLTPLIGKKTIIIVDHNPLAYKNIADQFFHLDTTIKKTYPEKKIEPLPTITSYSNTIFRKKISTKAHYCDFSLNVTLHTGELISITGKNGSGKTTLLKTIQRELGDLSSFYGFQNPTHQFFSLKVIDELSHNKNGAMAFLTEMGFQHILEKDIFSLSMGEKSILSLTCAVISDSEIILLDEPTRGLDLDTASLVYSALVKLANKGKTIVFSAHEKEDIKNFVHTNIHLDQGVDCRDI